MFNIIKVFSRLLIFFCSYSIGANNVNYGDPNFSLAAENGRVPVLGRPLPGYLWARKANNSRALSNYKKYGRYVLTGGAICIIGLLVAGIISGKLSKNSIIPVLKPLKKLSWMISKKTVGCTLVVLGCSLGSRSKAAPHFMKKILGPTKVEEHAGAWGKSLKQQYAQERSDCKMTEQQLLFLYKNLNDTEAMRYKLEEQREGHRKAIEQVNVKAADAEGAAQEMAENMASINECMKSMVEAHNKLPTKHDVERCQQALGNHFKKKAEKT